jgi:hypothetical protein
VFQYGDPRIDEPLALANRRALSQALQRAFAPEEIMPQCGSY